MINETPPVRITAFVGRSFLEEDQQVWYDIRRILESLRPIGFKFEDAKEAQLRPISEKVRQGIERNDIYIGILTRRSPIQGRPSEISTMARILEAVAGPSARSRWSTSQWIVQETGFALGRGKKVLLVIEEGVDFPSSDLAADTEWIPFSRESVSHCATSLTTMVGHLIAANLPAGPPAAQVAAPEEPTPEEEKEFVFPKVIELCDQRDFRKADELFETFLTREPEGFQEWLSLFYLRVKSVRGDTASLQRLKTILREQPQNANARIELARYHHSFERYDEAARILLDGSEMVSPESKPKLLRLAAEELAADKKYEQSTKVIANLLAALTDPEEIRLAYFALADIAKDQEDKDLESSALEQVLDLDPANSEVRFRLAYLYSEMNNNPLAVHHYKLRLTQGHDAIVLNNIGVAFNALKMPGREIRMYEAASSENALAKANLSHAYTDRGFTEAAKTLATEATQSEDDNTRRRATSALNRIAAMVSEEDEKEEKILTEVRTESAFRSRFAEAYVKPGVIPIQGEFETRYGKISFHQEGDRLLGRASFKEERQALFGLIGPFPREPKAVSKTLTFEATIFGRAGKFRLTIQEEEEGAGPFAIPSSSSVQGLLVLAGDGQSFEVLEQEEHRTRIYRATKVLS